MKTFDKIYWLIAVFIIFGMILFNSCALHPGLLEIPHGDPTQAIDKIYCPMVEHIFCMKNDGSGDIYKVKLIGLGCSSSAVPVCNDGDFLIHTHPVWCEDTLNIVDAKEYLKQYRKTGNEVFGLYWNGNLKLYIVDPSYKENQNVRQNNKMPKP